MPIVFTKYVEPADALPVAGATLWLNANAITGLSNGDPITSWDNDGSLGGTYTAGAGFTYHTSVVGGKPVVRSNGVNTFIINVPSHSASFGLTGTTVYVVQSQDGTDVFNGTFDVNGGITTNFIGALLSWSDTLYWDHGNNSTHRISVAQPGGWDDTFHYVELTRDNLNSEIKVDGSSLQTGVLPGGVPTDVGSVSSNVFAAGVQRMTGDIAEFIVFNTYLSSGDRTLMENYLTSKYGL